MTDQASLPSDVRQARLRSVLLAPLLAFLALAVGLGWALFRGDPRIVPSALIDKPVPEFELPPVEGRMLRLSNEDLKGEVSLVNVFASWCVSYREEHPVFMQIKAADIVPIHGLDYKDPPQDAAAWLDELGDPYTRTGTDLNGRVAIDWGVYGVPETFVVSADGRIAYKHIGPVTREVLEASILPLVRNLQEEAQQP